ncbi:MAG: Gfo/Idh/MocA family oxidoreductase [Pirellulales bacterium]
MSHTQQRRDFLKTTAAATAGFWIGSHVRPARAQSSNEKLNLALIGVGGRGGDNLKAVARQNIVALCDVDEKRAGKAFESFPQAKKYADFRKMFDDLEKQIDAVVISTPDHTHFHPTYWAFERGKHVYLEKPLAHSVWETRTLTDMAREKKLATQLGVQRHTLKGIRNAVALIQSGAIGTVKECHAWIGGDRGMPKIPTEAQPVPPHLNWDLWLGPAAERPYHETYCPYGWRFWWDFGTGETGNWGCHILDIPFWALGLKYPTRVRATGPAPHPETTPTTMTAAFGFPADNTRGPVWLIWYHGTPPILSQHKLDGRNMNNLFIGTEGMLLCGFNAYKLLPEEKHKDTRPDDSLLYKSPGFYNEWFNACKGSGPASCNFDYSGPMAETVLLGNVAYRAGGGFNWDHENLKAVGNDKANELLRSEFRKGWDI